MMYFVVLEHNENKSSNEGDESARSKKVRKVCTYLGLKHTQFKSINLKMETTAEVSNPQIPRF